MKTSTECAELRREKALGPPRAASQPRLGRKKFLVRPAERRGVSAVEFAIIAPLFVLLILGVIEFGRAMMVKQIITNAAREGARRAIIETATEPEVKQVVNDYLANASISGATVSVNPAS